VNCREVPLSGKVQKMAYNKLRLGKDSFNDSVKSSMRKRE
jgi:hypothetical protein